MCLESKGIQKWTNLIENYKSNEIKSKLQKIVFSSDVFGLILTKPHCLVQFVVCILQTKTNRQTALYYNSNFN